MGHFLVDATRRNIAARRSFKSRFAIADALKKDLVLAPTAFTMTSSGVRAGIVLNSSYGHVQARTHFVRVGKSFTANSRDADAALFHWVHDVPMMYRAALKRIKPKDKVPFHVFVRPDGDDFVILVQHDGQADFLGSAEVVSSDRKSGAALVRVKNGDSLVVLPRNFSEGAYAVARDEEILCFSTFSEASTLDYRFHHINSVIRDESAPVRVRTAMLYGLVSALPSLSEEGRETVISFFRNLRRERKDVLSRDISRRLFETLKDVDLFLAEEWRPNARFFDRCTDRKGAPRERHAYVRARGEKERLRQLQVQGGKKST